MLSDAVRRRLEALNREAISPSPTRPRPESRVVPSIASVSPDPFRRGEIVRNAGGEFLRFRQPLAEIWPAAERHANGMARREHLDHPDWAVFATAFPERVLFLDLETCGFAGSAIFLIGTMRQVEQTMAVELFLARQYSEERAILTALWQAAGDSQVLCTFNGKSFDWPMVQDRTTLHKLGDVRAATGRELVHVDLLHHARRRWKDQLPNCKLQTLERFLCGRRRQDDLGGRLIPAAYHDFVRTGNAAQIKEILRHNVLDLVTLYDLAVRLCCA